jgi:hypothetical protein
LNTSLLVRLVLRTVLLQSAKSAVRETHAVGVSVFSAGFGACLVAREIHKGGFTLVTLPRIVTPYHDSVDGTRARVTYQKFVTR